MPNASYDHTKGTWILQFIPMNGGGRPRSIRVRADALPSRDPKEQKRLATALACECERYCRLLEVVPTPQDIRHAERLRAITPEQATAMLQAQPVPPPRAAVLTERLTLERAALMHPSSQREAVAARRAHLAYLIAFSQRTGIAAVAELTLEAVQDYVAWMVTSGMPWDTRRHRLMYLRRASRMGATAGLPDVLGGLVMDKQGPRPAVAAFTLDQLAGCALAFAENPRARMAVVLGGFLGLRPSESIRVRCGDLRLDGMLPYAIAEGRESEAKNQPSRRILPVPPTIAGWMRSLAAGRGPDEPLIYAERGWPIRADDAARDPAEARRRRRPFTDVGFTHWLGPKLAEATGRDLPPKSLRKAFADWATRARLPALHIEQYLGHENTLVNAITGWHYLSDRYELLARKLVPTAARIEKVITAALASAQAKLDRAPPKALVAQS